MHDLADVVQRLRAVREAQQRFLALYAVEVALVEPGLDLVAKDLADADFHSTDAGRSDWLPSADRDGDDPDGPAPHGW